MAVFGPRSRLHKQQEALIRMGFRNECAAVAITFFAFTGGAAGAAEGEMPVVVLHIRDLAGTGGAKFGRAKAEADRIFGDIGVRLVWADVAEGPESHACEGLNLSVSLLSRFQVRDLIRKGIGRNALGWASPSEGYAFIYSSRVDDQAPQVGIDAGVLLGRVIAHEVGHLLLGRRDHAGAGIMTERVPMDMRSVKALFRETDADVIRARLRAPPGPQVGPDCGQ
jgi:hypothetical protein